MTAQEREDVRSFGNPKQWAAAVGVIFALIGSFTGYTGWTTSENSERLTRVETRLDTLGDRVSHIEPTLSSVEKKTDRLDEKVDEVLELLRKR